MGSRSCPLSFRGARQREPGISCKLALDSGLSPAGCPGMTKTGGVLRPCPLVAYAQQFHRPVRYCDPEGRADGAFHQMDVAAMGADQFGGDREPQPAAAGPACCLECLEPMIACL